MELIQAVPLPEVCINCHDPDCFSCNYGGLRWRISEEDLQRIRQKMLQRQKERLKRKKA